MWEATQKSSQACHYRTFRRVQALQPYAENAISIQNNPSSSSTTALFIPCQKTTELYGWLGLIVHNLMPCVRVRMPELSNI